MIAALARPWLPRSALTGAKCRGILSVCLAQWSGRWLASGQLAPARFIDGPPLPAHHRDIEVGPGLSLSCPDESRLELASLLLARPVTQRHIRTAADLALIDLVVDEALADLGASLRPLWASPLQSDGGEQYSIPLDEEDGSFLGWLNISAARLGQLLRDAAPLARTRAAPARPLSAIAEQEIVLGGLLGSTRLSLRELEQLEPGDVVVLDQASSLPVDLTVNGARKVSAAATIEAGASCLTLTIRKGIDQW